MSEDAAVTLDFTSSLWRKEDPKPPSSYTSITTEDALAETVELKAQLEEAQKRLAELTALIEANAETESTTHQNATEAQINAERADLKASDAVIQSDAAFAEAQRAWNEAHDTAEALFGVSTKADLADLKAQEAWNAAVRMGIALADADNQISVQDDLENQLFDVVAYGATIVSSNVNLLTSEGLSGRVIYQPGPPSSSTEVSPNNIWVRTSDDLPFWWNNTTWLEIETPATLVAASEASDDLRLTVLPRTVTYSATSPGAPDAGDIWVETDTGNTVRYWNLSAWVAAPQLVSDLFSDPLYPEDHEVTGSVRIFAQSSEPADQLVVGDLWLDINNGNALSRWNGSGWSRYGLNDSEALQEALELIHGLQEQVDTKITTHYGSSTPVDPSIGDLWLDTTDPDNTILKRYDNGTWNNFDNPLLQETYQTARDALAEADLKIQTYAQTGEPSGMGKSNHGDLWVNPTTHVIKRFEWAGSTGSWGTVSDPTSAANTAISNALGSGGLLYDLQQQADRAIDTFYGSTTPTGMQEGDLWLDTTDPDNTVLKRYDGSTWATYENSKIQGAYELAGQAKTTADDKITTFAQDTAPTGLTLIDAGDLWIDTNDGNKIHRWDGDEWIEVRDTDISTALNKANAAVTGSVIQYAVGASDTVAPTTGWSTSQPTRAPGEYIWMRTQVTYGTGTTTTTSPALITGNDGSSGTPAPVVTLTASSQVLTAPPTGGATSPATTTITGTADNTTISTWTYSVNGAAFSETVPAGVSRSGNTVTITGGTMTARTIGVKAASSTGAVDTITVAKVLDGATGNPGADAYTVVLGNESHTFPGNTSTAIGGVTTTTVTALKGATPIAVSVGTITGQISGKLTASVTSGNNTTAPVITVTASSTLDSSGGVLTIPLTVDGKSFTKYMSWSVAFKGSTGAQGRSITKVESYFRLGTTAPAKPTTSTPTGWSTTEPSYVAGQTLYRVERIAYNDGGFDYTEVTPVTSYTVAAQALVDAANATELGENALAEFMSYEWEGVPNRSHSRELLNGVEVRRNRTYNPRGVEGTGDPAISEALTRWGWTREWVTGIADHPEGVTTAVRTVANSERTTSSVGFDWFSNPDLGAAHEETRTYCPVTPGEVVRLAAWVRPSQDAWFQFKVGFIEDDTTTSRNGGTGTAVPALADTWTLIEYEIMVPEYAAYLCASARGVTSLTWVAGEYVDQTLAYVGPAGTAYFDGDTPDGAGAQSVAALAASKITTFYQSDVPTATSKGDLWVDTGNNRILKRWDGDSWDPVDDTRLQDAVNRIENAESLLDSKIRTFAQDAPPTGLTATDVGDLWIDTNDSNKMYRWQLSGGSYQWVILRDTGIQQAITTANSKNKIVRSTVNASGTTGYVTGDLWWKYSSDDFTGPIIAQWTYTSGSGWKASTIGSEVVAYLTVDKLVATGGAEFPVAVIDTLVNQDAFINRLTTERIMVGNFTNLIPNGDVSRGRLAPWDTRFTMDTVDKPTGLIASLVGPAGSATWVNAQQPDTWIEVNPGQKYIFDIWLKADKPSSRFYLELEDQNAALAIASKIDVDDGGESTGGGNYLLNNIEVPTTWTRFSDIVVVGANVQRVRLGGIYFNHSGGVEKTATVKISGARLRPIAGSDLIDNDLVTGIQQSISDVQKAASKEVADATDFITTEWGTQFATSADVGDLISGVEGSVSGLESAVDERVTGVESSFEDFRSLYNLWKSDLDLYVQIASNGIILGNRTGTNNFKVHITNTEMGFYDGTKKVAYLSNNRLYITDAEIINKLSLGNPTKGYFSFEPNTSNGNLSLKYRK